MAILPAVAFIGGLLLVAAAQGRAVMRARADRATTAARPLGRDCGLPRQEMGSGASAMTAPAKVAAALAPAPPAILVLVTLLVMFVLLCLDFGRLGETLIVMLSVPFAPVGGVWLMSLLETGVVMLISLDHRLSRPCPGDAAPRRQPTAGTRKFSVLYSTPFRSHFS